MREATVSEVLEATPGGRREGLGIGLCTGRIQIKFVLCGKASNLSVWFSNFWLLLWVKPDRSDRFFVFRSGTYIFGPGFLQ